MPRNPNMPAATAKAFRAAFALPFTWRGFADLVRSHFGAPEIDTIILELHRAREASRPAPRTTSEVASDPAGEMAL